MADEEAASIWGAGAELNGQVPDALDVEAKPAPRLFDDLGEADWGAPTPAPAVATFPTDATDTLDTLTAGVDKVDIDTTATIPSFASDGDAEEDIFDDAVVAPPGEEQHTHDDPDGFDDFADGFEGAAATNDDDFGDFGDFGQQQPDDTFGDEEDAGGVVPISEPVAPLGPSAPSASWRPLSITPDTTATTLAHDIRMLLQPEFAGGRAFPFHDGAASQLTQDKVRQVDGPSQVLVREESRQVWEALTKVPELQPVDWMRSKTRRQYLIAVGVPINLDELNSSASSGAKALPPLALKLDNTSSATGGHRRDEASDDVSSSPAVHGKAARDRDGSKPPEFDTERARSLSALKEDQLTLMSLPALRAMQREVEALTRQASGVLTHYLSQREAHAADAEMYNGLIRDLVTGAAKRVNASQTSGGSASRKGSIRKSSAAHAAAGSGRNSPAVGSPAGRIASPRT